MLPLERSSFPHELKLISWVVRMLPKGALKESEVLGRQMSWPGSLRESRLKAIAGSG